MIKSTMFLHFKKYLLNQSCFRIAIKSSLSVTVVSCLIQWVFRVNSGTKWLVNYTSRVLHGNNLYIENGSDSVRISLLSSGGCYINAKHGVYIGEGTIFSFNVAIVSEDHVVGDLDVSPTSAPLRIGKNCWIGANSTILPNTELGDNVVVGANSVVTRSFPEGGVIIAGVPARVIRHI